MYRYTSDEAKTHLPELIDAALRGEEVIIAQDDSHMVRLVPTVTLKQPRKAGSAKGTIIMSDDFDAPLPDFEEYI
jgi:antitoxin (DNA-binding transcriptional repressor) of toxin-antitoxin stability system